MAYVPTGFTPEQEAQLLATTSEMAAWQKAEEKRRKWFTAATIAGAIFAAARLGVVAIPFIKERRTRRA